MIKLQNLKKKNTIRLKFKYEDFFFNLEKKKKSKVDIAKTTTFQLQDHPLVLEYLIPIN